MDRTELLMESMKYDAAGVVVLDPQGNMLLLQRSDNGMFDIPKGAIEKGETTREAALRELKEETGIDGKLEEGYEFDCKGDKGRMLKFYRMVVPEVTDDIRISEEHTGHTWIPCRYVTKNKILKFLKPLVNDQVKTAEFVVTEDRLGSGGRFKALVKELAGRRGVKDPTALAAWIGRQKHGGKKMARWARSGRARKEEVGEATTSANVGARSVSGLPFYAGYATRYIEKAKKSRKDKGCCDCCVKGLPCPCDRGLPCVERGKL